MAISYGKAFEKVFLESWKKVFPKSFILRLPDQLSGYKLSSNICDFIAYNNPNLYLIECKSHEGNTFPLTNLTQYEKLSGYIGISGVRVGVIIWFRDHDKVIYLPLKTVRMMKEDDLKSVNITKLEKSKYRYFLLPGQKKRVFLDTDYSILSELEEGD